MVCTPTCSEDYEKKILELVPTAIGSINFHLTMTHGNPHQIEIAFYDNGEHESKRRNKIISQKFTNSLQKKFKGSLPSKSQFEDL